MLPSPLLVDFCEFWYDDNKFFKSFEMQSYRFSFDDKFMHYCALKHQLYDSKFVKMHLWELETVFYMTNSGLKLRSKITPFDRRYIS